jgi:hypothetical protein
MLQFFGLIASLEERDGSKIASFEKSLIDGIDECVEYVRDVEEKFDQRTRTCCCKEER